MQLSSFPRKLYTNSMKKYIAPFAILFFLLLSMAMLYGVYESKSFSIRSRAYIDEVSGENSFAVSTPSCVKADGEEITRMYIYCLSSQGLPVSNIAVRIDPSDNYPTVEFRPIQAVTDSTGKALFDSLSREVGMKNVDIYCGDLLIRKDYSVCFE